MYNKSKDTIIINKIIIIIPIDKTGDKIIAIKRFVSIVIIINKYIGNPFILSIDIKLFCFDNS